MEKRQLGESPDNSVVACSVDLYRCLEVDWAGVDYSYFIQEKTL